LDINLHKDTKWAARCKDGKKNALSTIMRWSQDVTANRNAAQDEDGKAPQVSRAGSALSLSADMHLMPRGTVL